MNKKDKQILLADLCSRLPYGVKVVFDDGNPAHKTCDMTLYGVDIWLERVSTGNGNFIYDIEYTRPYLRPMSSMSDEEWKEYDALLCCDTESVDKYDTKKSLLWLNQNHFDHNGLIEKGLALEAPEGMYK